MRDAMDVFKALADENRVRALMALRGRELCVCQIVELLGLSPSTVSKHMSILKQARLAESRKAGRWIYYRRAEAEATKASRAALAWLDDILLSDSRVKEDRRSTKAILKRDPEELCRSQCGAKAEAAGACAASRN